MDSIKYDTYRFAQEEKEDEWYDFRMSMEKIVSIKYSSFYDRHNLICWMTYHHKDENWKDYTIRFGTSHETDDIYSKRFMEFRMMEEMLHKNNNMINKKPILDKMLNKRIKQNYLNNISFLLLPHDIENLIFTFL